MRKNLTYGAVLLMALASCSKEETPGGAVNTNDTAVQFTAAINGGAQTRFANPGALSDQGFTAGDQFFIGVKNNEGGPANFSEKSCFRTITIGSGPSYTANTPLYWDDLGGRGTDAFIWGVYTHKATAPVIDKSGKFNWSVAADQTGVTDFQTLDLLYSNNKTHLVYTPNASAPKTRDVANMVFNHAMSRILINVKAGDGFSATEFAESTATLKEQFTSVDADLLAADTFKIVTTSKTDVKMCRKATPSEGSTATFDAIVAPGKTYAAGDEIATLAVSGNTYKLTANQTFVDALGSSKALVKGKYYVFNITIGKSGIGFTASITDWTNGYTTPAGSYENAQIVIDATDKGASTEGNTMTNQFGLFQSTDGKNYDSDGSTTGVQPSTSCKYDPATGTWTYDPAIYWQGEGDEEYFRGFYAGDGVTPEINKDGDKNTTPLVAGDTDYQWGTSGDGKISPTAGNVNMQFTHMMSNIIINLKTVTGTAAVNLEGAKVEITNTIKSGSIDLHTGAITLGTTREDYVVKYEKTAGGVYTHTTYAVPQKLNGADGVADDKNYETSDDAFVKITVNPGTDAQNTYYFKLNTAKDASNNPIVLWESNKSYIYNITIKKTAIEFEAKISEWIKAYESDDITIHL